MADSKLATRINNNIDALVPQNKISSLYVEPSNNYGLMEDCMWNDRYITFNGADFGGSSGYRFGKNEHFVKNIAVIFSVAFSGTDGHSNKSDYTAYAMIKNLRVQLGSLQPWNIPGRDLMLKSIRQCDNILKAAELGDMSGTKVKAVNTLKGLTATYIAHIPIYGSSLSKRTYMNEKPLPLHMIKSDNLELTFDLNTKADVFTQAGGTGIITLSKMELYYQYCKVANPAFLKKDIYKYPFSFTDSFVKITSGTSHNIDISGFRRAEATHVIWYATADATVANQHMAATALIPTVVKWFFNGDQIREESGDHYRIMDLYDNCLPNVTGFCNTNVAGVNKEVRGAAAAADTDSVKVPGIIRPIRYGVLKLADVLKDQQKNPESNYANGCDFSKQTLNVQFTTSGNATRFYYHIVYNSIIQFTSDGMKQGF